MWIQNFFSYFLISTASSSSSFLDNQPTSGIPFNGPSNSANSFSSSFLNNQPTSGIPFNGPSNSPNLSPNLPNLTPNSQNLSPNLQNFGQNSQILTPNSQIFTPNAQAVARRSENFSNVFNSNGAPIFPSQPALSDPTSGMQPLDPTDINDINRERLRQFFTQTLRQAARR